MTLRQQGWSEEAILREAEAWQGWDPGPAPMEGGMRHAHAWGSAFVRGFIIQVEQEAAQIRARRARGEHLTWPLGADGKVYLRVIDG